MNRPELISNHGDYLEKHHADKILSFIPGYAVFWSTYVGNDGEAKYLPMPTVSKEILDLRVFIWEHLYTLFESLALCWRLEDDFKELKSVENPVQYADNLNGWIAFYAHLGRIHDMAEKVAGKFQGENLFVPFDSFNENRHTVLHYPKVPMRFAESVLTSPNLGEKPNDWKQEMRWSELNPEGFHFLSDIVSSTLRDLEKVINTFMYKLIELALSQKGFVSVEWPSGKKAIQIDIAHEFSQPQISGTLNIRVSGQQ